MTCPSSTPYVFAILLLIAVLLALGAWAAYIYWFRKPTCPAAPVVTPVASVPSAGPPALQIYGSPAGPGSPVAGPNNALVQSGMNLILGTPQDPRSHWRQVGRTLQNVYSEEYLVVSPSGAISFTPNQDAATEVTFHAPGETVIGIAGVGGLAVAPGGRVVAQTPGPQPDPRMSWLVERLSGI